MFNFETRDQQVIVHLCDNGYVLETCGRNTDGDWRTQKIIMNDIQEVAKLVLLYQQIKID